MPTILFQPFLTQVVSNSVDQPIAKPLVIMVVLVALSMAPFVLMMTTSFVKISVVLSMIRTAIGVQQIPPNTIITGLALILTVYIMVPVGKEIYHRVEKVTLDAGETNQDILSMASVSILKKALEAGKEPMRDFLFKNSTDKDRGLFYNLANQLQKKDPEPLNEKDFIILVPAFVVSELSEAFRIAFVLFLPFLVIDMVVSNILMAMGMFMVSPITISLPFKLLLFVLVDGWYYITKGLIQGYI